MNSILCLDLVLGVTKEQSKLRNRSDTMVKEHDEIKQLMLHHYDIPVTKIKMVRDNDPRSRSFQIISENNEIFFLKRLPKSRYNHYLFVGRLIQELIELGFSTPKIISAKGNKTTISVQNCIFQLFEYVIGREFDHKHDDYYHFGEFLGSYHLSSGKITVEDPKTWFTKGDMTHIYRTLDYVLENTPKKSYSKLLMIKRLVKEIEKEIKVVYENTRIGMIHGDYLAKNIIINKTKQLILTDFEFARKELVIFDLINGIFSFVKGRRKKKDFANLIEYFTGYSHKQPFTEFDIQNFLSLALYQSCRTYLYNSVEDTKPNELKRKSTLSRIKYIQNHKNIITRALERI
ncbi:MAG: phosphotransferase enzyme family protein [Candidatus Hodarchaeales archaeon]|jgi:Ser/Thr protein kinase RdoA (MazF antagonist)